jgi:hypothetical protein
MRTGWPTIRSCAGWWGGTAVTRQAASTSQMDRFETDVLAEAKNRAADESERERSWAEGSGSTSANAASPSHRRARRSQLRHGWIGQEPRNFQRSHDRAGPPRS